MAIDLSKVKKRLNSLQNTSTKQKNLWKPEPGKTIVRIVPYKFAENSWPFIELYFHYNIGTSGNTRSYLSPMSFGRKDPIVEFSEKLKSTGNKDDWKLGKKLEPKLRTFCPIIVRGKELEGIKFWGFGKEVYQELLGFIAEDDWGDITDPATGNDITVTFLTAEEAGRSFSKTTIKPKPAKTVITDRQDVIAKIEETQVEITELYKEPTYEDLQEILQNWLKTPSDDENTVEPIDETETSTVIEESLEDSSDGEVTIPYKPTPSKVVVGKTPVKSIQHTDAEEAFKDLFKVKK